MTKHTYSESFRVAAWRVYRIDLSFADRMTFSDGDDQYVPGPHSQPQPGVPKGKTFEFPLTGSKIFLGTTRKISLYVPAQYLADKPTCVYIALDALLFEALLVFDNMIFRQAMAGRTRLATARRTTHRTQGDVEPREGQDRRHAEGRSLRVPGV